MSQINYDIKSDKRQGEISQYSLTALFMGTSEPSRA